MDTSRNDLLGEIAADAALERSDFLVQATEQLRKFLSANNDRINELGGLVLIDEDPDYLSIAPELTFRSRTRYLDDLTGEWTSETEVIESAAELVELYNPADLYQAFAEAAREAAGLPAEPTAEGDLLDAAGIGVDEGVTIGAHDPYAAAADEWAATQPEPVEVDDDELAAQRLYDLALEFQERSQRSEARLLEQFEDASSVLSGKIGDLIVNDDEDERLTLTASGEFRAEVLTEENEWRPLATAEELVEYYDPTDVFGDLADALAEAFPSIAPELAAFEAGEAGEPDGADKAGEPDEAGEAAKAEDDKDDKVAKDPATGSAGDSTKRVEGDSAT
ncbi:MAG: hypothetical protein NVS9B8_06990 [Candidatus Limnocylindrales bacterium]